MVLILWMYLQIYIFMCIFGSIAIQWTHPTERNRTLCNNIDSKFKWKREKKNELTHSKCVWYKIVVLKNKEKFKELKIQFKMMEDCIA